MTAPVLRVLTVPGPPVGKERPRVVRGVAFTPAKTREAERRIKALALAAGWRPLAGPVSLTVRCYFADRRRRDLDNCFKLVADSLNGVAYGDDSQIRHMEADGAYDPAMPRTEIEVLPMPEAA